MDEFLDEITGYFIKNIFKAENFMVSIFKTDDDQIVTTGTSFDFEIKQKYILRGKFVDHPKYGFQFNISTIEKYLPSKQDEIIAYLSSKAFKGVGKSAAKKIYEVFGNNTLTILKDNPERLNEVKLTDKQLLSLQIGFSNLNDPVNETMYYLISNGFSNIDAQKIYNRFKLASIEVGKDNPFKYYLDTNGINFEKVKNYALKIEFSDAENKYKEAFIIHIIKDYCFNSGDTYIEYEHFIDIINKNYKIDNLDEIIKRLINNKYLVLEDNKIYLFENYDDENFISTYLLTMLNDLILDSKIVDEAIIDNQNEFSIKYDPLQVQAIKAFFENNFSIIVGGPGTGKTTIVKAMSNIFKEYFRYQNLIVVAPTGRAAKRITEICDVEAKTIHSLLKWNKELNIFTYDYTNPLMYDAIIIDEFSMVDSNLFACLLRASSNVKKICIIGDDNQLPSIRPGYVLNDLIESKLFKTTFLKANFRQNKGNEIINLSNSIINNNVDLKSYNKDISFIDIKKDKFDLIDLINKDINDGYSLDEIQVLAPMYKGTYGIDNLNVLLQDTFNPKDNNKKEKTYGMFTFRENDKILQLKNRPTDDVYNGDIGRLLDIDFKEKSLLVKYQDIPCFYNFEEINELYLAYAMSVHKAQGSEYQIVYFIFTNSNMKMLNSKLIYTAISRAKSKLVIIGEENTFYKGIASAMKKRNTSLKEKLIYMTTNRKL